MEPGGWIVRGGFDLARPNLLVPDPRTRSARTGRRDLDGNDRNIRRMAADCLCLSYRAPVWTGDDFAHPAVLETKLCPLRTVSGRRHDRGVAFMEMALDVESIGVWRLAEHRSFGSRCACYFFGAVVCVEVLPR